MFLALLVLACTFPLIVGCESQHGETSSPESAAVSSIPWNKPANWEGAGALGGFMPQGAH
jgi:hypothetical protein